MSRPQFFLGSAKAPIGRSASIERFISALEGDAVSATAIRAIRQQRSRRREFFCSGLFSDPAWDILLELYSAFLEQRRISVSALCDASEVPSTTGLRWIAALESEGLLYKTSDPFDGRRIYVNLSRNGRRAMYDFFAALPRGIDVL